jgi:hypothetical protein
MGRSFQSVRQDVNSIADRWERASKKYKYGKMVVQIAKSYSGEGLLDEMIHLNRFSFQRQ